MEAAKSVTKNKSGTIPYMESVIQDTPTGRAIQKMCDENKKNICLVLFNSTYYLAK